MSRPATLFVALAGVLAATRAGAEPPPLPVRLDVVRGPGTDRCPGEDVFRRAVRRTTRAAPFADEAGPRLLVTIRRQRAGYEGAAELYDEAGVSAWTLELDPVANCSLLVQGLGFAVAVKLDPIATKTRTSAEPPPQPRPVVDRDVAPIEARPPAHEPPAPRAERPRIQIGASVTLASGAAPGTAPGVAGGAGIRWPAVSIGVEGRGDFASQSGRVGAWRLTGAVVPCGHWKVLFGCVVGEIGVLHGTSTADHPKVGAALSTGAGPRAGVDLPLGDHLAARFSGEALMRIGTVSVAIDGAPRWSAPPVSGTLRTGLVAFF